MKPPAITHYTATSCIGIGLDEMRQSIAADHCGLHPCDFDDVDLVTWIGQVQDVDSVQLPSHLHRFDCRNNRLAWLGLQQDGFHQAVADAAQRFGRQRVAVFLGTSTSGILDTELAYRRRLPDSGALPPTFDYFGSHNVYSVAAFVRDACDLRGPALSVSTACSSSAKVFATAARYLELGIVDAAIVGGVDSLCLTTLFGFNSLELTAPEACRPYDQARKGISIGEAAAFALMTNERSRARVSLLGYGESSDAYHMSSPHPEGRGAQQAMQAALDSAGLDAEEIDYINLHGTGTRSNDLAEGKAVHRLFGDRVSTSSSKGATGHTLGAAGGLEAVISAIALENAVRPGNVGLQTPDPDIPIRLLAARENAPLRTILSNSFGFGGTNASLILGKGQP